MEEAEQLPLKRVELSLSKFNEVAIPHHLDLLRQHRANIVKLEAAGAVGAVRAEQERARLAAARLRALLAELEALRARVRPADRARFDALTQRARDTTLRAVVDYLGSCPVAVRERPAVAAAGAVTAATAAAGSAGGVSTDSVGLVAHADSPPDDAPLIQLHVDDQEASLEEREAVLRGWGSLQAELRALHAVWQHAQAAALAQREQVSAAADRAEAAAGHVGAARAQLAAAERLRAGAVWAGGAALGALAGGPVGLAVGAKAGAAAALAGSLLGYLGARLLRRPVADTPHKED